MIQGFLFHAKGTELETHTGEHKGHQGQQCDSSGIVVTEACGGPQTPSLPSPLLAEDSALLLPRISNHSTAAEFIFQFSCWSDPEEDGMAQSCCPVSPQPRAPHWCHSCGTLQTVDPEFTGVTAVARDQL